MGEIVIGIMPTPCIHISPTVVDFEIATARAALEVITAAVHERGGCLIAFSGGHTPSGVYRRLGDLLVTHAVDMSRVYLIFVDERMVPPNDPDSNYGMVQREFIARVPIPPLHICRIRGEAKADTAAHDYERELQTVFPLFGDRCDLILLGVGEDGHTASLFPGTEVLCEAHHKARAVLVPRLGTWRVTVTLPVINCARTVFFLVTGVQKASVVGRILANTQSCEDLPASLVHPGSGTLAWMLDADAASQLPLERSSMPNVIFL
jgi:6-phosphogluconolactonase